MSEDKRARLKQWLASGEAQLQPLSFPQRELWETSPVDVNDPAHYINCILHIRGLITTTDCEAALQRVVDRQDALRTSFLPGKDRVLQMVRKSGPANFEVRELTSAEGTPEALEEIAAENFARPLDLVQGPLHRVVMCRRAANDMDLAFSIHHSVADGWSLGVFVQDLCVSYLQGRMGVAGALPAVPMTYTAWGASERALWTPEELERRLQYWRPALANRHRLWSHRPRPVDAPGLPKRWVGRIPGPLGVAARDLARRQGTTLYSTLLTAFQTALAHWTGQGDITVGTPVANRAKKAVHETMGYCAGVVPVRGQVNQDEPFSSRVKTVHQATVEAFGNAMPFVELATALGETGGPGFNPLFEVRFALQNHPVPEVALANLAARLSMRSTGTPRLDLACEITEEGDPMEVVWLYRPHLFTREDIQDLDRLFQHVLSGACRSPDSRGSALLNASLSP